MRTRGLDRRILGNFDWKMLLALLSICGVSLVTLYSAGFNADLQSSPQMRKQAIAMGAGTIAFVFCSLVNTNFWRRWCWVLFGIGCCALMILDFAGIVAKGSRRWLELGPYFRLQPSEFTKIALVLVLARIFGSEDAPKDGYSLKQLLVPLMLVCLPVVLVALQPDLGTALTHLLIAISMIFVAGVRLGTVVRLGFLGLASAYPLWMVLHDYQRKRIITFLAPETDPLGSGYHAIQSQIAVGSGTFFGKGFLQGTQTQLRFLPEQTTDFIFSVLAEEWGFVGSILVLALYAFLLYRAFSASARCKDRFPAFVCFGVSMMLFWHVIINIGMVIGVVPVVGITLPLLSYGGSSVVAFMSAFGLVAGISMRRYFFA